MERSDALENMRWSPRSSPTDGPKRICKFCILGVFLPVILLCLPLYMRFLALQPHLVNMSPLDMKLLNQESTVSTVWCQGQELRVNGTFSAYLLPRKPKIQRHRKSVNMTRKITLPDDVKEYWGFYLLKGSEVKLSVCSRYEGASFIVVKSLKDARRCAFLGELDSEEESDENSDSDEFEFVKDNRPTEPTPTSGTSETTPPSPTATASKEMTSSIMTMIKSMPVESQQSMLKKLLLQLGHDPASEELLNDPRITSKFITINKKKVGRGPIINTNFTDVVKLLNMSEPAFSDNDDVTADEDGAFEQIDDDVVEDKGDGMTGLTDRGTFNFKTKNDRSREETKSSWSSSEEALARCEGLIYNIPLNGDPRCSNNHSMHDIQQTMVSIKYEVVETGFYYFIFANENEIVDNFIVANFNLQKTLFDVSEQVMNCTNTTGSCVFPLTFWSEDFVVLEAPESQYPAPGADSNSTELCIKESGVNAFTNVPECHYVMKVVSICQPRRHIYVVFILLVPIVTLFGANL